MTAARPAVRSATIALGLSAMASQADAHLVDTGLGPFYDGIGHFFLTPEAMLPVLALALVGGLRGRQHGRAALLALLAAWIACGFAGLTPPLAASPVSTWLGRLAGLPLLLLGVLAAIDPALSVRTVTWLALLVGAQLGVESGATMAQTALGWRGLFGTTLGVAVFATLATAFVAAGTSRLLARRIARVAGSWLAASGLLLLGWSLR